MVQKIADAFSWRTKTVGSNRQRIVQQGVEQTLEHKKLQATPVNKFLDGEQEAKVIATRLGSLPQGYSN